MKPTKMWHLLQIAEYEGQLEEAGELYTDGNGVVRCKHDRDVMGTCWRCVEESRQGLPPCYALYEQAEGWFWIWKNPDSRMKEVYRDGPFESREDARVDAWESFEERIILCEINEKGYKVEVRGPR